MVDGGKLTGLPARVHGAQLTQQALPLQVGRNDLGTPAPHNEPAKGGSWLTLPKLRLAALPRAGRAGDIFGRRRKLVADLVVPSASSLVGALATPTTRLVIAPAVQGVGAAMAAPALWL